MSAGKEAGDREDSLSPGSGQAGFTLIGALVLAALMGLGAVAYAELASHAAQREKEAELLFRGDQYRLAIESYYRHGETYPQRLEELLEDSRHPQPVRHLRKLYPDPITGSTDWGLVRAPEGGIMGVFTQSEAEPVKKGNFLPRDEAFAGARRYMDWQFFYRPKGS
jgi:type II secretory pathway pseudopilin PulG